MKTEKRTPRHPETAELRRQLERYASWTRHFSASRPREARVWRAKAVCAFRGLVSSGARDTAEEIWTAHGLGRFPA